MVTTTADVVAGGDGQTSLREAVTIAAGPGRQVVVLPAGQTFTLTRCGADDTNVDGDLDVLDPEDATYVEGHGSTVRQDCDGERLFDGHGSAPLVLRDLALRDGSVDALDPGEARGGAVRGEDAVWLYRTSVMDSSVTGTAAAGGGVYGHDVFATRSTVARNLADGPTARGGGVAAADDVVLEVSTLSGNEARGIGAAGGGASGGPDGDDEGWRSVSTTVYDNVAPTGANLHLAGDVQELDALAIGKPGGGGENCAFTTAPAVVGDNNVEDGTSCGFDELRSGEPLRLEALADNGGAGLTHYPQRGSPVLATDDSIGSGDRDQRGLPYSWRDGYDAGAVEADVLEPDRLDVDASWGHEILVRWEPPEDNGGFPVTGYRLSRDGERIATFGPGARSFLDTGVTPGEQPVYAVRALNRLGPGLPGTADATVYPLHPWSDVASGLSSWAADWLHEHDLYAGFGDGTFRPRAPQTRSQVIQLLWRAFDEPIAATPSDVSDVPADAPYRAAVDWAVEQDIVELDGQDRFHSAARATRHEAVAMVWAATGAKVPLAPEPDIWVDARRSFSLKWVFRYQLLRGYPGNRFRPSSPSRGASCRCSSTGRSRPVGPGSRAGTSRRR